MPRGIRKRNKRTVIVGDTSALISLELGGVLTKSLFLIHYIIPQGILKELKEMGEFDDNFGKASARILKKIATKEIEVNRIKSIEKLNNMVNGSTNVHMGEAEALILAQERSISILITDDFRSLNEIKKMAGDVKVHLSVYVLTRLVLEKVITKRTAKRSLDKIVKGRNWENTAIYIFAKQYIDDLD